MARNRGGVKWLKSRPKIACGRRLNRCKRQTRRHPVFARRAVRPRMCGSATVRQSPGGSEKSAFIGLRAGEWRPRHVSALGGDKFEDLFREGMHLTRLIDLHDIELDGEC